MDFREFFTQGVTAEILIRIGLAALAGTLLGIEREKHGRAAGLRTTLLVCLAACIAMIMFSLAGIPPLFGFWGKFVVFQAAVDAGMIALAAIGIAASVIGAFYYLKVVKVMYFDEPAMKATGKSDWVHQAILALCALAISPLGYLATKALALSSNSSRIASSCAGYSSSFFSVT